MTPQLDPFTYVRLPKLDVATALGLAKILLHRVPGCSSPPVHMAVSDIERALVDLKSKWRQQVVTFSRSDARPLARRLGAAWSSIRDRLGSYSGLPEDNVDRARAIAIHDMLFFDGLEFLLFTSVREHAESERRIEIIDERGLAEDLERLAGSHFLASLRAAHQAYGDALGISKAAPVPAAAAVVNEPLRVLVDAISGYALQLLAVARYAPDQREAIALALAPIEEFRAAAGRRVVTDDDEEEDAETPAANDPSESQPLPTGTD